MIWEGLASPWVGYTNPSGILLRIEISEIFSYKLYYAIISITYLRIEFVNLCIAEISGNTLVYHHHMGASPWVGYIYLLDYGTMQSSILEQIHSMGKS